jgi:hypothetical protein
MAVWRSENAWPGELHRAVAHAVYGMAGELKGVLGEFEHGGSLFRY